MGTHTPVPEHRDTSQAGELGRAVMQESGRTFKEHLLDLAEAVGQLAYESDGTPALPDNVAELGKLKRRFNDGLALMYQDKPNGWAVLTRPVSITIGTDEDAAGVVDGDTARYRLPIGCVGQPLTDWTWFSSDSTESGSACQSVYNQLSRLNGGVSTTGAPIRVGVAQLSVQPHHEDVGVPLWELQVYPRPDRTYRLEAWWNVAIVPLVGLDQRQPFGQIHDLTVASAARWCYVRADPTHGKYEAWKADYQERLAASIRLDDRNTPAWMQDTTGAPHPHTYNRPDGLEVYNGVALR